MIAVRVDLPLLNFFVHPLAQTKGIWAHALSEPITSFNINCDVVLCNSRRVVGRTPSWGEINFSFPRI
jgi:hypothetical protein